MDVVKILEEYNFAVKKLGTLSEKYIESLHSVLDAHDDERLNRTYEFGSGGFFHSDEKSGREYVKSQLPISPFELYKTTPFSSMLGSCYPHISDGFAYATGYTEGDYNYGEDPISSTIKIPAEFFKLEGAELDAAMKKLAFSEISEYIDLLDEHQHRVCPTEEDLEAEREERDRREYERLQKKFGKS